MASQTHSIAITPKRKANLLKIFAQLYPDPKSELNFANEYQLLLSVMLSAQCTDKKVNQVTPALFKRFPDFASLSVARLPQVENIIRPINYFRTKAKALIATSKLVETNFNSRLPRSMELLRTLPGVGQKTANVVLNELGIEPTFPVDTHVFRVSRRLGLADSENAAKVEEQLKKIFAPETWRNLHHYLIFHGRRVCKARNPLCAECALSQLCPSAGINAATPGAKNGRHLSDAA